MGTGLSHCKKRRGEGEPGAGVKRAKVQKGWATKMAGLYRKEPVWAGRESRLGLWDAGRTWWPGPL